MLIALGGSIAYLVYRLGIRKGIVHWKDSSLALLLERRFPDFHHSLITTVQALEDQRRDASPSQGKEIMIHGCLKPPGAKRSRS